VYISVRGVLGVRSQRRGRGLARREASLSRLPPSDDVLPTESLLKRDFLTHKPAGMGSTFSLTGGGRTTGSGDSTSSAAKAAQLRSLRCVLVPPLTP
jgi:hypothetical protein